MVCPVCTVDLTKLEKTWDSEKAHYYMAKVYVKAAGPVACGPGFRRKLPRGFWTWLIGHKECSIVGVHLHQECTNCGARWTCLPAAEDL